MRAGNGGRFWYVVSKGRMASPAAMPELCKLCGRALGSPSQQVFCAACRKQIERNGHR